MITPKRCSPREGQQFVPDNLCLISPNYVALNGPSISLESDIYHLAYYISGWYLPATTISPLPLLLFSAEMAAACAPVVRLWAPLSLKCFGSYHRLIALPLYDSTNQWAYLSRSPTVDRMSSDELYSSADSSSSRSEVGRTFSLRASPVGKQ